MKSGPGSVSSSFGIPFDSCVSRLSASSPSKAWMSTSDSFTFAWARRRAPRSATKRSVTCSGAAGPALRRGGRHGLLQEAADPPAVAGAGDGGGHYLGATLGGAGGPEEAAPDPPRDHHLVAGVEQPPA